MPDDSGALSQVEREKFKKWIEDHAVGKIACQICKNSNWLIADHLLNLLPYVRGAGLVVGGQSYPQAQLVCQVCGTAVMVNAVFAGIVTQPKGKDKKNA